jgi:hypothetical protein
MRRLIPAVDVGISSYPADGPTVQAEVEEDLPRPA